MLKKFFLIIIILNGLNHFALGQYGAEITLKKDATYTSNLSSPLYPGQTLYIELTGIQGMRSGGGNDFAEVIVTNIVTAGFGKINVTLNETTNSNVFRGIAVISNNTDDTHDRIGAVPGDILLIRLKGANITVDGDISDWSNSVFYKQVDTSDVNYNGGGYSFGQLNEVWLTSDDNYVYLVYKMAGIIDSTTESCYISFDTVFDVKSGGTANQGDYAPWWIYFTTSPPPGYPLNYMYGDYCARAFYDTQGASPGYFGTGSLIYEWNGTTWADTGHLSIPAENDNVYAEIAVAYSNIGNPTNICGATFRVVNTAPGYGNFNADLMYDSATPSERPPLYFKPAKYVKTTVSITSPPHSISVLKRTNIPEKNIDPSTTNNVVISVKISDDMGHQLKKFAIENLGDMKAISDISAVKLYVDNNGDNTYDAGDTFGGNLYWDGSSRWTNNNLNGIFLPPSGTNFIITVDTTPNLKPGTLFKARIPSNGVACNEGASGPFTAVTNEYYQYCKTAIVKIADMPSVEMQASTSNAVFLFRILGGSSPWCKLTVKNIGTLSPSNGISNVCLFRDVNTNNVFDLSDIKHTWPTQLGWDSNNSCWTTSAFHFVLNNYRYFIVVYTKSEITPGNTFKAVIPVNGFIDANSDSSPAYSAITNKYPQITFGIGVTKYDISSYNFVPGETKKPVIAFNILDSTPGHNLKGIKIGNAGNMKNTTDVSKIELWKDNNKNRRYDIGDIKIADLYYNGVFWTNGTLTSPEIHNNGDGVDFIITIDVATTAAFNSTFKAFIPINGVKCDGGHISPNSALTNSGVQSVIFTPSTIENFSEVYIYPNPVKEMKKITIANLTKTSEIKIFTLRGELIEKIGKEKISSDGKIEWDFSRYSLAHGVYIVYIKDEQGNKKTLKFVYTK